MKIYFSDKKSKLLLIIFFILFLLTCIFGYLWADEKETKNDIKIYNILSVSKLYGLTREQAILMCGIYEHELTPKKQMKTFGYFGIRKSDCAIINHCVSDEMLFIVCAGLCAETIKKRCPNMSKKSLENFGRIYAEDKWWLYKVKRKMKNYKNILY